MSDNARHNQAKSDEIFHDAADHGHGVGHIVPIKYLVAVALALLVLTWLTVAVMAVDLGRANIYVALAIAVVKASLVMLFFMHLFWDRAFNSLVMVTSMFAVLLFIAFALTDTHEYQDDVQTYRASSEINNAEAKKAQDRLMQETVPAYEKALQSGAYDHLMGKQHSDGGEDH